MASLNDRGVLSVRVMKAMAVARGSKTGALAFAESQRGWQDAASILKAAVTAEDMSSSLASTRVDFDWAAFLRPQTLVGRLPLVSVPFLVRLLLQSAGGTGDFIGEGRPIAVSKSTLQGDTLPQMKVAAINVVTRELLESSAPNAEVMLQRDLARANVSCLDKAFIDPENAGIADVKPASVLYGVSETSATGTNGAAVSNDLASLLQSISDNGSDLSGAHFIMPPKSAIYLSRLAGASGAFFPSLGVRGGSIWGVPVVVTAHATRSGSPGNGDSVIACIDANEIAIADDGVSEFSSSTVTSIEMSDAPTNETTDSATAANMVSMFQTHSAAVKMTRFVNWKARRSGMTAWFSTAAY